MNRRASFLTILIAAGGLILLPIGVRIASPWSWPHLHEHAAEAEEQQLYTCAMHPFIIRDKPGKCPICGMDLVPVVSSGRREDGQEAKAITIDPAAVQNMGVRTVPVARRDLARTVRTVGVVNYDEARQYSVNAKVAGWIERLHVTRAGEAVKAGDPLLDLYSPDLVAAQQEFMLAVRNNQTLAASPFPEIAAGAAKLLAASRKRLSYWDISAEQIDALERTGEIKKNLTLYSPHSGVVTKKMVNSGGYLEAGMELFELSDITKVWVFADIYEYELPWVKQGQPAVIHYPYPRTPIKGRIALLYPYVEAKTRTVKARIEVDNADLSLKPDMYVTVEIDGVGAKRSLVVPLEAVLRSGRQETVFVALGGGKFEPRQVRTGLEAGEGMVQILDGLKEGEEVVTAALFMLDSESRLQETVRKMAPLPKPVPAPAAAPSAAAPAPPAKKDQKQKELEDLFK